MKYIECSVMSIYVIKNVIDDAPNWYRYFKYNSKGVKIK